MLKSHAITFGTVNQNELTNSLDSAFIVQPCKVHMLFAMAKPKPDLALSLFSLV